MRCSILPLVQSRFFTVPNRAAAASSVGNLATEQLPLQVLETLRDIRCGQEILLEYAELPAHAFLMQYDFLPLHPAYVLSNLENHTLLHSAAFIDHLTQWRHPINAAVRQQLKDHVLTRMGMPVPFAPLGLNFEECEVASLRQASSMLFTLR